MFNVLQNSNLLNSYRQDKTITMTVAEEDEMMLSEHIEEFSQRIVFCVLILVLATLFCFTDVKEIVRIFKPPLLG